MDFNKVIAIGRLTADPELKQTPNNVSVVSFTVAVGRPYQKDKEKQADFITCVAYRQTAEFISKYFEKGSSILIQGSWRTRTYQDKKYPDVKHYASELYIDSVNFGESKAKNDGNQQTSQQSQTSQQNDNSASLAVGNLSEFEEILGNGDLPF